MDWTKSVNLNPWAANRQENRRVTRHLSKGQGMAGPFPSQRHDFGSRYFDSNQIWVDEMAGTRL